MTKQFDFYGVDNNFYKLDDTIWEAIEDESDGYRSYLGSIEQTFSGDKLIFFPQPLAKVTVQEFDDGQNKGYNLVDVEDNHVWLFIGTNYYDDYYPCFRFEYTAKPPKPVKNNWDEFIK